MVVQGNRMALQKSVMVLPGVLIYLTFMALPIILTGYYSFTDWDGVRSSFTLIGFENFIRTVQDKQFLNTIQFTLSYTVVVTLMSNVLGLLFALFLQASRRSSNIFRSAFFMPLLISPIAAGFVWKALFNYTGIINIQLEKLFGIDPVMFLGNAALSQLLLICFSLWQNIGFCMVIYLAGLQTIPQDLYDSTAIDGASSWTRFWYITFPFLAPATTSCVTFMFTSCMREYPRVLVLTAGGPVGATETLAYRIVDVGFKYNQLGYASAMAIWVLILTSVISMLISWRLRKREEFLV